MQDNIKSTQEQQPEKSSSYAHPRVQHVIRDEVDRLTHRIAMLQAELERANTERDDFQRWLDAREDGER